MTNLLNVNQWTNTLKVPTINNLNLKNFDFELNLSNVLKLTGCAAVGATAIYLVYIYYSKANDLIHKISIVIRFFLSI